jgi:hypothetical protein
MLVMEKQIFNLYEFDRLTEWKRFRDHLETSEKPFEDLVELWSSAPFVSRYLNPLNPDSWPDPWKLIIDGKFDNLAIALGMLYTLKLTERFKDSHCEICEFNDNSEKRYFLIVDNSSILNYEYRSVRRRNDLVNFDFTVVWTKSNRL